MFLSIKTVLIFVAAFFGIIIVWFFMNQDPAIKNFPTSGTTIVSFGDSLVFGEGTTQGNDFSSLLNKRIGQPVKNLGVSGDTTGDALKRIGDVLNADPKIVIVLLGGNDTLRRVPVETTYANLDKIITQIIKSGAAVVLIGAPGGLYGSQYEKMYETLVDVHGVAYVPNVLKGLITHPEYMSDSIHPNDAGHQIIANRIEPKLLQVLSGPR